MQICNCIIIVVAGRDINENSIVRVLMHEVKMKPVLLGFIIISYI